MQEAARKDVERCFGVLQARFAIVNGPSRFWNAADMKCIMKTCIILHNMIVEDKRDDMALDYEYDGPSDTSAVAFEVFLRRYRAIHDSDKHYQLRNDLIDHLWNKKGSTDNDDNDL